MPKLYSAREIVKALERMGFIVVTQKGSHIKLKKMEGNTTLSVVVPNHKEVAFGTLKSILKQAGITRKTLEDNI